MPRQLAQGKKSGNLSRLRRFAQNNLGVVMTDDMNTTKEFRSDHLDLLDRYYENSQYDDLPDWEEATSQQRVDYIEVRKRKPRIIYNLGKVMVEKVAAKLVGSSTFPQFIIEDEDDDTAFLRTVIKASKFRSKMIDPMKKMLISGAVFVRYYLVNGSIQMEYALSKYCYPTFDAIGELDSIDIKYVFEDQNDRDSKGSPKRKWYRLTLNKMADILYDNPEYRPGSVPDFNIVAQADHGLGWVQGEWFKTHDDKFNYDGIGLYSDITGFIDELNYSLSQSSQANGYAQEPQLTLTKIDEDEIDALIKSTERAWNLGREGEAKFLESTGKGIETAIELRDKMLKFALDVVRVCMQDPDKDAGHAQSGEALKQLNAPIIELVDDLRAVIEPKLVNLLLKIALTTLHYNSMGESTVITTPDGYMPKSLDVTVQWPLIFPPTLSDISMAAAAANSLSQGQIISRESLTRWIAQMIPSIDNVEEELKKIGSQEPLPSPFGSFGGGA